uniref:Putative secreted protein n=1 Tax=Panstrongylus lignarius TaxID=156445 RepID=A0A224Y2X8_9HEMI
MMTSRAGWPSFVAVMVIVDCFLVVDARIPLVLTWPLHCAGKLVAVESSHRTLEFHHSVRLQDLRLVLSVEHGPGFPILWLNCSA